MAEAFVPLTGDRADGLPENRDKKSIGPRKIDRSNDNIRQIVESMTLM